VVIDLPAKGVVGGHHGLERLREANGYHGAIQKGDDSLTLKPVEPTTAAAYKKTFHEWNPYVHF
jgi:hypothetical protein